MKKEQEAPKIVIVYGERPIEDVMVEAFKPLIKKAYEEVIRK